MPGAPRGGSPPLPSPPSPAEGALVPCLMLKHGEVFLPSAEGPVAGRTPDGGSFDPFEVVDRLTGQFSLIYLVDLEGVERAEPQLDFLQELSREANLWVDGGVRTADQAIDILVTGAQRAVLSSATLRGMKELRRSWRLSTELVFELELDAQGVVAPGEWEGPAALPLVDEVRKVGVDHIVVSPREIDPDWAMVRAVAAGGPTWVDGSFERGSLPSLKAAGARGGIFHIGEFLGAVPMDSDFPLASANPPKRDDET